MWCDKRLHIFISGDDLRLRQIDVSSWQMCFVAVDVGGWWWPPFNICKAECEEENCFVP